MAKEQRWWDSQELLGAGSFQSASRLVISACPLSPRRHSNFLYALLLHIGWRSHEWTHSVTDFWFTCLLSRQVKNTARRYEVSTRIWFMSSFTSRRCSCLVLSCVQCFSDSGTGWEWELEPQWDLKQLLSPKRRISVGHTLLHSPQQST